MLTERGTEWLIELLSEPKKKKLSPHLYLGRPSLDDGVEFVHLSDTLLTPHPKKQVIFTAGIFFTQSIKKLLLRTRWDKTNKEDGQK